MIEEVKQTPEEAAVTTYRFVCADLAEGLNYTIGNELYNNSMSGIGSTRRTEDVVTARQFANDFWEEWQKRGK